MMLSSLRRTLILYAAVVSMLQVLEAQSQSFNITLAVDAREAPKGILHVAQTLPVQEGTLTLLYPQWIPGEHGPTGPVVDLVNLRIATAQQTLPWRRDAENMYAFHCTVPPGVSELQVTFDFLLPSTSEGFTSGASSTAQLLLLSWNQVVLYPQHRKPDDIAVTARLHIPEGWGLGTALEIASTASSEFTFKPVSLTMLVDSPVLTGKFFKRVDLGVEAGASHTIELAGDAEYAIQMPPHIVEGYRRLVREALALFGARHYHYYRFLYTLSDNTAHFGLEHHQSSDNRVAERTFFDSSLWLIHAGLLPHEFVHSWNGKYRRPAGLATGDFSTPMKGDMLWVYEGLTQYLGNVLTARSGLRTVEQFRDHLALRAAELDHRPGREWRPLQDVADAAQILYGARRDWASVRRGVDFYDEGTLIWLEADAIIRQQSKGKKSLDDFCKAFHGGENTGPMVKPYTFDELVSTLQSVVPYDWRGFLMERLNGTQARAPLGGIERSGWKIVYRDSMNSMMRALEERDKQVDLRFSLGTLLSEDGTVLDVVPNSAAWRAGVAPNMKLIAVNGRKFSKYVLREALRAGVTNPKPLDLLVQSVDYFMSIAVDYHGGERYPYLERDASRPDLLSAIIKPVVASASVKETRR
jgi:predicted metalloprotease with PDZ domain